MNTEITITAKRKGDEDMNDMEARAKRNRAEKLIAALRLLSEEQRECYENAIIGTAFANSMINSNFAVAKPLIYL